MRKLIGIAAIACLTVLTGSRAFADEPTQKVDVNQLYVTNTVCLSENKAYSVGAVLKGLRCTYYDTMTVRPAGTHPPDPPRWEAVGKR